MNNNENPSQEDRYIQTKRSIISNFKAQRETEKQYLMTVDNLLGYWRSELEKSSHQDKKRQDELLKLINTEKGTIKKINNDIERLDKMIDQTEKNLDKIKEMVSSLRKER